MQTGQSWLWCKHDRYYAGEPAFVLRRQQGASLKPADTCCPAAQQQDQIYEGSCHHQQRQQQLDKETCLGQHAVRQFQQQQHGLGEQECPVRTTCGCMQHQMHCTAVQPLEQPLHMATQQSECETPPEELVEDQGWLMALCYDAAAQRSELVLLDAQQIESGPVAVLPLRKTIPHGLHGTWSDVYYGPKL